MFGLSSGLKEEIIGFLEKLTGCYKKSLHIANEGVFLLKGMSTGHLNIMFKKVKIPTG